MSSGLRIIILLALSLYCGFSSPSLAVYSNGISPLVLDRLEQLRFGHTNRDLRIRERLDVLEWSVMGGRQPGSLSERLAEVQQKVDSEGTSACINNVGPTYNVARPRTGYLVGRYPVRRIHRTNRSKVVVARAPRVLHKPNVIVTHRPTVAKIVAQANDSSPQLVTGLIRKGNDLYMSGDYRKSIRELTHAIEINPSYAPAYVSRGYAYAKLGRTDMEKSDFQLAKKLDSRIQLPM